MKNSKKSGKRFFSVAGAGVFFQAGSAAVDSATIMSALIYQLTTSSIWVGATSAILRFGWLFPQLFVGFLAQRSGSSMGFYVFGAFGRALMMAVLALVLLLGRNLPFSLLALYVMLLWVAYAFISGIVAVPYNDIVARSIPSGLRSRLLATRFFGGGLLALVVVAIADRLVSSFAFPVSYAAIIAMASILMFASSVVFVAMGDPGVSESGAGENKGNGAGDSPTFFQYLEEGIGVFRKDRFFSRFVFAQWCGGAVLMAMPFYVVQASQLGLDMQRIALLLGAQTLGSLLSNFLWGWWGDRLGKASLYQAIAFLRVFPPLAALLLFFAGWPDQFSMLAVHLLVFFVLGALANGLTIAVIGFLMEISPNDRRPAYSGYFNAMTAPAFLLPLLAGIVANFTGVQVIFMVSALAAILQFFISRDLGRQIKRQGMRVFG